MSSWLRTHISHELPPQSPASAPKILLTFWVRFESALSSPLWTLGKSFVNTSMERPPTIDATLLPLTFRRKTCLIFADEAAPVSM